MSRRRRPEPLPERPGRPWWQTNPPSASLGAFRGRGWNGQYGWQQHKEQELPRQKWCYRMVEMESEFASVDPDAEYQRHRQAYEATGNLGELNLALEFVREDQ